MENINERIDNLLNKLDISKAELSRQTNIPVSTIKSWILVGAKPSAEAAYKVAKYLGVSVEWLVNGDPLPVEEKTKEYEIYNDMERELIAIFRHLDERDKNAVLTLASSLESQYSSSKTKSSSGA